MSTAAFIARMGIARLGKLGDSITTAIVAFDPATASEVQMDDMTAKCEQLAARVSQAVSEDEKAHKLVLDLQGKLAQTVQAAHIIGEQIKAGVGDVAHLNTQLNTLMDAIEKIGGPEMDGTTAGTLFDAQQDFTQAEADLHEWQTVHTGAVQALTTARKRLEQAAHDMERAHQQEEQAQARQEQAKRDAGLRTGLDVSNVALSAMETEAAAAKQRARAAQINTQALKTASGTGAGSADDIVQQTLTGATVATSVSALDRLARLNKAA